MLSTKFSNRTKQKRWSSAIKKRRDDDTSQTKRGESNKGLREKRQPFKFNLILKLRALVFCLATLNVQRRRWVINCDDFSNLSNYLGWEMTERSKVLSWNLLWLLSKLKEIPLYTSTTTTMTFSLQSLFALFLNQPAYIKIALTPRKPLT